MVVGKLRLDIMCRYFFVTFQFHRDGASPMHKPNYGKSYVGVSHFTFSLCISNWLAWQTPYYMFPELMQEKAYDRDSKSDIWSVVLTILPILALLFRRRYTVAGLLQIPWTITKPWTTMQLTNHPPRWCSQSILTTCLPSFLPTTTDQLIPLRSQFPFQQR